jgi:hypothetical protein
MVEHEPFDPSRALPLKKCRSLLALAGQLPHIDTLRKAVREGRRLRSGRLLRLRAVRMGGAYYLMASWCGDYRRALIEDAEAAGPGAVPENQSPE